MEVAESDTSRDMIEFLAKRSSWIARLDRRHIARMGKLLGLLAFMLDNRHRRIVRRNLRFTHPEWSKERIRKTTRSVYQNMGVTLLEICQIPFLSREDILQRVRLRGGETLTEAMGNPAGVIMVSAHLGNWEMAPLFASCYFRRPVAAVARRVRPETLNRWLLGLRGRFGNIILDKESALPRMARLLRRGMALGILIDQGTMRSEGLEVKFFGKTVTATPAPALLARRYNVPVIPAFCVREADQQLTLIADPPLKLQRSDDLRADLIANTQMMTDAIERAIRAYPDQWFWFHKRWKRHYPHLYREDLGRRLIRKRKNRQN